MRWLAILSWGLVLDAVVGSRGQQNGRQTRHNPFVHTLKRDGLTASYDYIVVGSGPGGGPLAANLAIAGYKVLLIDAGGDSGNSTTETVPILHLLSSEFVDTAWTFYTNHYSDLATQQRDSKMVYSLQNGSQYIGLNPPAGATPLGIDYPRAGTLGGCSRHNALFTILPQDSDWTYIANLTGDTSWSPANMSKYWQAMESNRYLPSSVVGHGYNGWLTTQVTFIGLAMKDLKFLSLLLSGAAAAGKGLISTLLITVLSLGSILTLDLNAPGQTSVEGYYQVPLAMKDGVRASPREFIMNTATAVNPDGSRKYYLDIKLNTLVSNIVFDRSGARPRAVGVQYQEGKNLYRAHKLSGAATVTGTGAINATREVIVAGGTFNTPQLLKLSGIGPAAELKSFGIPVVVDLPGVGANMQDRYEATVVSVTSQDFDLTKACTFTLTSPDPCLDIWNAGTDQISRGVYATNGGAVARVMKSSVAAGEPDLFIFGAPISFTGYYPGYAAAAYSDKRHWSWVILKAHSRNAAGTVALRSTDPRDTPSVTFNSFAQGGDADVQAVADGVRWARAAMSMYVPAFGAFNESWPAAAAGTTDAELKQWIRNEAWGHHASCTCAIGADGDPMAVLDSRFRVRGVDGLRVVDASAFPKIPGFFIAAPLYMMSQKASAVIVADAQGSHRV